MKQISTYSKMNAHLLTHTHISRMALYAAFLFIGVLCSVGNAWGATYTYDLHSAAAASGGSDVSYWYSNSTCTTHLLTYNSGDNTISASTDLVTIYYKDATIASTAFQVAASSDKTAVYFRNGNPTSLLIGKNGAVMTLPTYSGEKITNVTITTSSGCGSSVTFNIFSGTNAASTQQTGAPSTDFGFDISAIYQSDALKIKVTNGNNLQISAITITTAPSCSNYAFFYGTTKGSEDHSECFSFVTGSTDTWLTDLWTIPSADQWTYVGEPAWDASPGKSANLQLSSMPYALNHANNLGTIGTNVMEGAQGYVKICSNSTDANRYVGFIPAGYVFRWGTDGSGWNSIAFTGKTSAIEEEDWYTPIQTWTSSNADDYTYVGLKTNSGYVWANRSEARRPVFLKPTSAWDHSSANFAIYYFDASSHTGWSAIMTDPDGDGIYEAWIPNDYAYTTVNFVRLNATGSTGWDNKWNQTGNITLPSDKNVFTITGGSGDAYTGEWSLYDKKGKFHISANSNTNNWYCHFWPHHVLHFDANGGSGEPEDQSIAIDASPCQLTVSATEPTRTGYTFLGWNESSSAASKDDAWDGGDAHAMTGDVTLYAVWSANTIEITLDKNNSDASGSTSGSASIKYDATAVLSSPTHASRTGYTLEGYYAEVGCTNKVMTNAGVLVNYSGYVESGKWVRAISPTTLYAKWTANNYTISLDDQSPTTASTPTSITATFNSSKNLTGTVVTTLPTKTGYRFDGYYTATGGEGLQIINTSGVVNASKEGYTDASKNWIYADDKTLYAHWIPVREFVPVTSSTSLEENDEIIFYGSSNFMSTTQNTNNRANTTIDYWASGDNYIVSTVGSVQRAILEASGDNWLFNVGIDAYLYAASSNSHLLKTATKATAGDNGKWTISVDGSNNATITAQGTNEHNLLKYNSNQLIFSAYTSGVDNTQDTKLYYYHCTDPYIRIYPSSLETFTYAAGYGPSLSQSLQIKGYNLTGNLTVACPSGYELSSTSAASGFGTSNLTLTKDANDKVNATIYIRLAAGKSAGSYNQTLTISGGGITSTDVSLSGSVVAAPSGTAYTLVTNEADIFPDDKIIVVTAGGDYILGNTPTDKAYRDVVSSNFSIVGPVVFVTSSDIQNILIEGADDEWRFNVDTENSKYLYSGTSSNNLNTNTWTYAKTNGNWNVRVDANTFVATVKSNLSETSSSNRNWLLYNYGSGNTPQSRFNCYGGAQQDYIKLYAKPSATANVCGSPSALSGFETTYGTASTAQTISVKARNISTGNVTVTAPPGYEVCLTENGTYTSSVTITPSDGVVSATTVYVRLSASSNKGTYNNSNLTISDTDAATRYVTLSGEITCGDPGLAFTDDIVESLTGSSVVISDVFSTSSEGAFTYTITPKSESPADGITFNTSTKTITVTKEGEWDITLNQEANGNYCADEATCNVFVACGTPATVTGLTVSDITYNGATLSWNAVDGADHYELFATDGENEVSEDVDGTSYTITSFAGNTECIWSLNVVNSCGSKLAKAVDGTEFTTKCKVTYHSATEDDYVIGVASGGSVVAHGTDDCDNGKIFVGWTTTAVDALQQSDPTTNETGAIASVTANTDLYAVFAAQNGYTTTTMLDEKWNVVEWDGTNKIVGGAYSSWATNFAEEPAKSFKISETTYKAIVFDVSSARTITSESAYSNLKEVRITGSNRSSFAMEVTVKVSADKSDWTTVDTKSLSSSSNNTPETLVFTLDTKGNYYVRIETQAKSSGYKTGFTNIRLFQEQDYYLTDYSTTCDRASTPVSIVWSNGEGTTLSEGTQPTSVAIGTDITMPTLTKANYRFDGWKATLSEATKSDVFTGGDKYTVNHPVTFTAQWTQVFSVSDPTLGLTSYKDIQVTSTTQTFTTLGMHNAVPSVTLADGTYFTMTINSHTANSDDEDYSYTFTYQPNAYGTGSGAATNTTTATITDARTGVVSSPITLRGRSLPDEFVIAVKKGDQWYALPNTILNNAKAITPLEIRVNNSTTPTAVTAASGATIYKGTGRYASGTNKYGIRLTDPDDHWLQVSSSSGTNYVWVSGTGSSTCQDWWLSSSDFNSYTLQVPSSGAGDKSFGINNLGNIGYYSSDATNLCKDVYLLPIEFSVTYNDNGATSGEVPTDDSKYSYNAEVTVLGNTGSLVKTGYTFLGWNTQADGNGTDYDTGETFDITACTTLYAKWQNNAYEGKYTFHYGDNSTGTWTVVPFSQVGETDEWTISNFTIPDPDDYPNFYVGYEGWFVSSGLGSSSSRSYIATWDEEYTALSHWGYMRTYPGYVKLSDGSTKTAEGAVGTLHIKTNMSYPNVEVGFEPSGYGLTIYNGSTSRTVELKSLPNPVVFETDLFDGDELDALTAAEVGGSATYKVSLKTASGYVDSYQSTEWSVATLNTKKLSYDTDITANKNGRFQVWRDVANYDKENFGLRYTPLVNRATALGFQNWSSYKTWTLGHLPRINEGVLIDDNNMIKVDVDNAVAKYIRIGDGTSSISSLTINQTGALLVVEDIKAMPKDSTKYGPTNEFSLVIKSDNTGNGALIVGNKSTDTEAGYNFYSRSFSYSEYGYINQYIGIPFASMQSYQFYDAYLFSYDDEKDEWKGGVGRMYPFKAYNLIQLTNSYNAFYLYGNLNLPGLGTEDEDNVVLECTTRPDDFVEEDGKTKTDHLFANSWTAPLDMSAFETTDFVNLEAAIQIFNAGSANKKEGKPDDLDENAGNYTAVTIDDDETPFIPGTSAFLVKTKNCPAGTPATLTMNYKKHVYDPALDRLEAGESISTTPTFAPRRNRTAEQIYTKLNIIVYGDSAYADKLRIREREDFTNDFDNGWEASKTFGLDEAPQLYAISGTRNLTVAAVPDMEGMIVGFRKGTKEDIYTLAFEYDGSEELYMNDLKEKTSTRISSENEYTFSSSADDSAARFIISTNPITQTTTGMDEVISDGLPATGSYKFIKNDKLFIYRNGTLYDATGKLVK